ncbi:multidrug efflux SMR transporter [Planococcus shenhongbingii]|uniref:Multidrug efflux SMR transporter n=1 Tax=Planococcus shenhongbingii TaxID=3058398 RepID=A0ABT8NDE8_9BACL|nr:MULTISPECIES: multidrug efflux SMR transporter [unclassified Planococcus (in: firmicutes)]MDN7245896.1 multidrug efflux SMR transporter [Planococcus sp. N017]WKA60444.1 multidrug efflux SMR transporter [Planococcus sp. N016]
MHWMLVIVAGIIEILWAIGLKYASSVMAWVVVAVLIYISFVVLLKALEKVPVATAYAVFTGIGTAGTVIVEMVVFGEPFSWTKVFFISLLLAGVIGLKLVTADPDKKEEVV